MLTSTRNRQHRRYHGLIFNPAPENRPLFRFLRFYMRADIILSFEGGLRTMGVMPPRRCIPYCGTSTRRYWLG